MSPIFWSVGILGVTVAGMLWLRTLSARVRLLFDMLCLAALSVMLYVENATPWDAPRSSTDALAIFLRLVSIVWWVVGARVAVEMLYFALRLGRGTREAKLFVDLLAAAVYACTALVILKTVLGLPVEGLVATSGLAAVVFGLALQSTLSDVFSGIAVGVEAPFQVGHRIALRSNGTTIEGHVTEMNWRSVRIQTDGADVAIIPNSVVAKLEIINRSVPTRHRDVSVELWCPSSADPERVMEVLSEATLLCPTIVEKPPPVVTLSRVGPRFSSYAISFSVADSPQVATTRSALLRHARRQLYHARLWGDGSKDVPARGDSRSPCICAHQMLHQLALFDSVSREELDALALRATSRMLAPGDTLFSQGSSDAMLHIVAAGIIEVSQVSAEGRAITIGHLGAGEYVGEIGLLTGAPHAATAIARTHCTVYQLSRAALEQLLATNSEAGVAFERAVRRGLELLHRRVAARAAGDIAHPDLLQRLRAFFGASRSSASLPPTRQGLP